MELFIQIIGWVGALLVVFAYFLVSHKKVDGGSALYRMMNLFGAIFMGINLFHVHAWPVFAVQVVWAAVAISAPVKRSNFQ